MSETMKTTITDKQIEALRREAAEHDDLAQEIICRVALGQREKMIEAFRTTDCLDDEGYPDFSGSGHWQAEDARRAVRMTEEEARAECARAIADASAQE